MPAGRPTMYNQKTVDAICWRLSKGESLRSIVKDDDMPESSTIYDWLLDERYTEFAEQYEKARNKQAEHLFEEILEIADDGTNDWVEKQRADGKVDTVLDAEHVQRSRLRVDVRKWYLSKVLPKKYGEKLDVTTDGQSFNASKQIEPEQVKRLLSRHGKNSAK